MRTFNELALTMPTRVGFRSDGSAPPAGSLITRKNDEVKIIKKRDGKWVQIEPPPDTVGWVSHDYITLENTNSPPKITPIDKQSVDEDGVITDIELTVDEGEYTYEDKQILYVFAESSNTILIPNENIDIEFIDYESDAQPGFLHITPAPDQNGFATVSIIVDDGYECVDYKFPVSVSPVNDKPTLSALNNQTIDEDGALKKLAFTIDEGGGDDEDEQVLKITAKSSNIDLIANASITIDFDDKESDADTGFISLFPIENGNGSSTITLIVNDGVARVVESFLVTVEAVNDVPTVTDIEDVTGDEDAVIKKITFSANVGGGKDEQKQHLEINALSSNTRLIPDENITLIYSSDKGFSKKAKIQIKPMADEIGKSTITISVSDGISEIKEMFDVTIIPVNDPPVFEPINDIDLEEDTKTTDLTFIVDEGGSADEDAQTLTVLAASSNKSLIPDSNIILEFGDDHTDASGGTLKITPLPDKNGTSAITLTANDGTKTTTIEFNVNVVAANDPPEISHIPNQSTVEGTQLADISFTASPGGGEDENSQMLKISVSSSNQELLPNSNINVNFPYKKCDIIQDIIFID